MCCWILNPSQRTYTESFYKILFFLHVMILTSENSVIQNKNVLILQSCKHVPSTIKATLYSVRCKWHSWIWWNVKHSTFKREHIWNANKDETGSLRRFLSQLCENVLYEDCVIWGVCYMRSVLYEECGGVKIVFLEECGR